MLHSLLGKIRRRLGARLPLQCDPALAEAGLACLSMVAGYHGMPNNFPGLRRAIFAPFSYLTLAQMMQSAGIMGLNCRPVRIKLGGLAGLALPAILQWHAGHYVVLKSLRKGRLTLHDPAGGVLTLNLEQAARHFTGIAIEVEPAGRISEHMARSASEWGGLATRTGDRNKDCWPAFLTILLLVLTLLAIGLASHFEMF